MTVTETLDTLVAHDFHSEVKQNMITFSVPKFLMATELVSREWLLIIRQFV